MNKQEKDEIIKFIQDYRLKNFDIAPYVSILSFRVDVAKKVDEIYRKGVMSAGNMNEKGSDQQIATKNKKFISYRKDEYVDYDKAFIITGEMENDRISYNRLIEILDVAVSDREKDFDNFDINPYVERAEKVVEDYTRRTQGTPNYLDQNDNDLVAMELLYRIESES